MNSAASVGGREQRVRLFCALRLPDDWLDGLAAWVDELVVGRARRVVRDNLHVTLAFLGHRPAEDVEPVAAALREAAADAAPPVLRVVRYRETRSVGMLVCEDEEGRAGELAADLHGRLQRLGVYEPESRPWLPHVTVLRFRERPRLHPPLPELGPAAPSDAAVYVSRLGPKGAQYFVLESVPLGGS
jgi:RNA 2',3'-cyclic 3'-phosphodiesterase